MFVCVHARLCGCIHGRFFNVRDICEREECLCVRERERESFHKRNCSFKR